MAGKTLSSCTTNAKTAGKLILHGNLVAALESLLLTSESGKLLEDKLDSILQRLESLENYNKKKETEYYQQLKELEHEKSKLRDKKSRLEQTIAGKEASITETERQLKNAEDDMESARHEKSRAQNKYNKFKNFWWVPVWGTVLTITELIEDNEGKARAAKQKMNRYEEEIDSLRGDIRNFRDDLESLNGRINQVQSSLTSCNQKINNIQSDISNITSAIAEVLDAKVYWKNSVSETRAVNDQTSHMQRLVKAGGKKPSKFSSSKATKHTVDIYESSWEKVENILNEAFLNKILITFTCTQCKTTQTSLPYIVSSDNFVCEDCY